MTFTEITALLGNLGEFVGAIAVVATLLYLAAQIRHSAEQTRMNTASVQATSYNQAIAQVSAWGRTLISDPETRSFLEQALREPESIAEEDQILFTVLMGEYFFSFENLFRLYEQGVIDAESWANSLTNSRIMFDSSGARQFAAQRKGPLSERFWAAVSAEFDATA